MAQIEKYKLPDFKYITAVELLNYLNSYFQSLVCYTNIKKEYFIDENIRVFSMSEVKEGINIVKKADKYHRDYIDAMLSSNYEVLYDLEMKFKRNTWKKRLLKSILLKF